MADLLQDGAEAYLGKVLGLADFRIAETERISGNGLSRTVIRIVATSAGVADPVGYVLLMEQAHSPVAPNQAAEFAILRALAGVPGILVPPAYWVEADPEAIGAAFLLTGLLPGTTNPKKLLAADHVPHARQLIEQSFEMLGTLAAIDVASLRLDAGFAIPERDAAARTELHRCETIIRDCDCGDEVVTSAALRYLHRTLPPSPDKLSIVHGDYRLGNYLFEPSGLTGVIDWEMVHVGDPLEDLAWALLPLWEYAARPGLAGGLLLRDEAISAWQRGSGLTVDRAALHWWTVFGNVKAISIWTTARHMFATNDQAGFMPGLVGYALIQKQESDLADLLHRRAA